MRIKRKIELFLFNRIGNWLENFIPTAERNLYYSNLLSQEFFSKKNSASDNWKKRLVNYQFIKYYNPLNPTPYFRKLIKDSVWGGEMGKIWHDEERISDPHLDKYAKWRAIHISHISNILEKYRRIYQVVEIGCGNGKYLQNIQNILGKEYQYLGIDLSDSQIEWNKKNIAGINFMSGAADEMSEEIFNDGNIFITFGTLSCFTENELEKLLSIIYKISGFQAISISEWNINYDPEIEVSSKSMSPTLYNHSYRSKIIQAGFIIDSIEYIESFDFSSGYIRTIITAHKL